MDPEARRAVKNARRRIPVVLAAYKEARGYDDVPESDLIDLIADALLFADSTLGPEQADSIQRCALDHFETERPPAPAPKPFDPCDELAPDIRARLVDQMGFEPELMGGGCYALASYSPGHQVLVTGFDGGMPEAGNWQVGIYANPDIAECIFNLVCDPLGHDNGGAPQPLSLFEAVQACLSIVAERERH